MSDWQFGEILFIVLVASLGRNYVENVIEQPKRVKQKPRYQNSS